MLKQENVIGTQVGLFSLSSERSCSI